MPIESWGADVAISLPDQTPATLPILVDLGGSGFGFTAGGICHNINAADLEELKTPNFAPPTTVQAVNG